MILCSRRLPLTHSAATEFVHAAPWDFPFWAKSRNGCMIPVFSQEVADPQRIGYK